MTDKQFVVTDAQLQRIYASGAAYSMEKARNCELCCGTNQVLGDDDRTRPCPNHQRENAHA